jgi:mono/diheme cytochrome c family protein
LWAAEYGEGEDLPSRYCLGCHNPEGAANKKVPEHLSHPKAKVATNRLTTVKSGDDQSFGNILKDILVGPTSSSQRRMRVYESRTMTFVDRESKSKNIPPLLPLYNVMGKPGNSGILSCPSCHDIHNSEAEIRKVLLKDDSEREKYDKNLIRSSFMDEATELCGECHGPYRLKAFWGFHGEAWGQLRRQHIYRPKSSDKR